jgi:dipeptidyl-peptidase 4
MKNIIYFLLLFIIFTSISFSQSKLTIEDIYGSAKFYEDALKNIYWKKDGSGIVYREMSKYILNKDFKFYDFSTFTTQVFINGSDINQNNKYEQFADRNVIWSPNAKHLLFTGILSARNIKSGGDFFLYNIVEKSLHPVNNFDSQKMLAQFSPDSKYIGYVKESNLFIADIENFKEKQLTLDGGNHILNGYFDWVYEEEFDIIEGWIWSPDSKHIAFWQIDESEVPVFEIPLYNGLYPKSFKQKYPKPGEKNSKIRIGVVNIEDGKTTWFQFEDENFYIPRIQWLPDSKQLALVKLNRLQNHIEIYLGDINSGDLQKIFNETDKRWIEIRDDLKFLENKTQFVLTSEKSGFRHIYLNDYITGESKQITSGNWQIREISGINEKSKKIYFTATKESELENHLYRVDFDGSNVLKLSNKEGWHDVSFSPDCKYYLDEYSNIDTPTKSILFDNTGNHITTLIENDIEALDDYDFNKPEFIKIPVEDNVELNGWILKPPDFDSDKKYPLLIYTYAGPGSQKIQNKWGVISTWFRLLSQNGIIVACVDNRGTEGRGADFKKYVHKKLGQFDVQDQIQAAKYLGSLDFVDANRIGMYGWSYGGYMALMCLMQGNDVFNLAVSVAPVTDWRYYDTIYTEIFMQTPSLNKEGYELGSVMNYVDLLKGELLLIHGMSDDNVHFQNSAELAKELVRNNKQFECMFYPGSKHSILGKREHVFTKITDFILENL